MLLGIMLLSIISVILGAGSTPGRLWALRLAVADLPLCPMMWHPSKTSKSEPPQSPDTELQRVSL